MAGAGGQGGGGGLAGSAAQGARAGLRGPPGEGVLPHEPPQTSLALGCPCQPEEGAGRGPERRGHYLELSARWGCWHEARLGGHRAVLPPAPDTPQTPSAPSFLFPCRCQLEPGHTAGHGDRASWSSESVSGHPGGQGQAGPRTGNQHSTAVQAAPLILAPFIRAPLLSLQPPCTAPTMRTGHPPTMTTRTFPPRTGTTRASGRPSSARWDLARGTSGGGGGAEQRFWAPHCDLSPSPRSSWC